METVSELLRAASDRLKRESAGMSLRAVAKRLDISPSYWSKILRGQRPLSQSLLPRVVKTLSMDVQAIAALQFAMLHTIEDQKMVPATGLKFAGGIGESPVREYRALDTQDFWLLEDWYHIPVLNAVTLTARPDITQIAARLKLNVETARASLKRLVATGFITVDENGFLERTDRQVRFPTRKSHPQIRRYHGAMIQKAHAEISSGGEGFDERLISSVCFAGSREKLQAARLLLEEAIYRAANLMADNDTCDEIYQLNVQVFPLTK